MCIPPLLVFCLLFVLNQEVCPGAAGLYATSTVKKPIIQSSKWTKGEYEDGLLRSPPITQFSSLLFHLEAFQVSAMAH